MRLLLVGIALFALAGCDLLASGPNHDPITVSGTVVFAETGAPLADISATIIFIASSAETLATTNTDAAGRFSVTYDPPEQTGAVTRGGYAFEINTNPYDGRYTTAGDNNMYPGTTRDLGSVTLTRNPNLP